MTGLELSRLADLPLDVIEEGRQVAYHLAEHEERNVELSRATRFARRRRAILEVPLAHFRHLDGDPFPRGNVYILEQYANNEVS